MWSVAGVSAEAALRRLVPGNPFHQDEAGSQSEGEAAGNKECSGGNRVLASSQWTEKDPQGAKAAMQSRRALVRMGVMPGVAGNGPGAELRLSVDDSGSFGSLWQLKRMASEEDSNRHTMLYQRWASLWH